MDFNKLEQLKKLKKISYEELSIQIGMSKNGLNKAVNNKEVKVSTLEKLANYFGVPISYFFDSKAEIQNSNSISCHNCEQLQKLVDSQGRHIERLEVELEQYRKHEKRKTG